MYWLVEEDEQLEIIKNWGYKECFIHVIPLSHSLHPVENKISLIYLRPIESQKGYMLCIKHSETFSLEESKVLNVIKNTKTLFCIDKKELLHYLPYNNIYDINLSYNTYKIPLTNTHEEFYNKIKEYKVTNYIIPIVKHYEMCEQIFNDFKDKFIILEDKYFNFFNNKSSVVFNGIERNGIKIDKEIFKSHFYNPQSDIVYTRYNLKTLTSRPSNSFKGVNFAALNKKNNSRESFIPKNDYFLEIDISAYHPTLISFLIDYKFKHSDVHQHLANLYNVGYKESKHLTFTQLYGNTFDEYKHLEFFKRIDDFKDQLIKDFNNQGQINTPISGYTISKEKFGNLKKSKLFNYLLQSYETSMNVEIIWSLLRILLYSNTQLVLYTYDSFTLDVDKNEEDILTNIRNVFKQYNLNIKESKGNNYTLKN